MAINDLVAERKTSAGRMGREASPGAIFSDHGGNTESPIDLAHLRRYTLGDRKLEKEVLDLFLTQLPVTVRALTGAASIGERGRAAHTLKGSGRAVGAWRIAALAEQFEALAKHGDDADLKPVVAEIEAAMGDVHGFVANVYAE